VKEILASDVCNYLKQTYKETTPAEVLFTLNLHNKKHLTSDSVVSMGTAAVCCVFFEIKNRQAILPDQLSLTFQTFNEILCEICSDLVDVFVEDEHVKMQNFYLGFADRRFVTLTTSSRMLDLTTGQVQEDDYTPPIFVEGMTYNTTKIVRDFLTTVKRVKEMNDAANRTSQASSE